MSVQTSHGWKNINILLLLLILLLLVACKSTATAPASLEMIEPGDKVNGVLVTQGDETATHLFDSPCTQQGKAWLCSATFDSPVNVTASIYGSTAEERDDNWETFTYSMTIDGKPVNLPAFGTIDFKHERTGYLMRSYNLVLIGTEAVTLTIRDVGRSEEDLLINDTTLITFNPAEEEDPILPISKAVGRTGQHPYTSAETDFQLLLYLPGDYGKEPGKTWPLILYLAGGINVPDLAWIEEKPIPAQLVEQEDFPFIVASPLDTGMFGHWSQPEVQDKLVKLLAELQALFSIDPDQVYLTGWTDGANGTWALGLAHPELFTAMVPIGGYLGYPYAVPEDICDLKDLPMRVFHGEKDTDVPLEAEQMLVEALETCGSGNIQLTIIPDAGHEAYASVYADPDLYDWMLEQGK